MEISAIASLATNLSQIRTNEAVQMAVLKKAMDISSSSALQLLQALPAPMPAPSGSDPRLGSSVDTFA